MAEKLQPECNVLAQISVHTVCAERGNEVGGGSREEHLRRNPWDLTAPVAHALHKNGCRSKHVKVEAGTFYGGSCLSESRERRPERKQISSAVEPTILLEGE